MLIFLVWINFGITLVNTGVYYSSMTILRKRGLFRTWINFYMTVTVSCLYASSLLSSIHSCSPYIWSDKYVDADGIPSYKNFPSTLMKWLSMLVASIGGGFFTAAGLEILKHLLELPHFDRNSRYITSLHRYWILRAVIIVSILTFLLFLTCMAESVIAAYQEFYQTVLNPLTPIWSLVCSTIQTCIFTLLFLSINARRDRKNVKDLRMKCLKPIFWNFMGISLAFFLAFFVDRFSIYPPIIINIIWIFFSMMSKSALQLIFTDYVGNPSLKASKETTVHREFE
jgi:hypothetical protein